MTTHTVTQPTDPIADAQGRIDRGDVAGAIAVIQQAVDRGDANAMFQAALWRLIGAPLPRDLPRARLLLRRAVEIGQIDAALMEIALIGNGSGGPANWTAALDLLKAAARSDPLAAEHLAMVAAMALRDDGMPSAPPPRDYLLRSPDIIRFQDLLSPAECDHLISAADGFLAPAVVVDPASGKMISHPIRTSDGAIIGPTRETLVIQAINRRLAAISSTQVAQGEPLSILRYAPGQQYRLHSDALPGAANQRIATVLVYLNDGFGGGETDFPAVGVTVSPRRGDAILFWNVGADGRPDQRLVHAGLPVDRGVKWLATRWIRAQPHDPWTAR